MFYIRADGNSAIGMGHVMRCLSIADAALELDINHKPVFIIASDECQKMISDRGFEVIILKTDYRLMESELEKLSKILSKEDVILVDSYQVTDNYYKELGKLCHVSCLEDMGNPYPVELLINYNIYAPQLADNYIDVGNKSYDSTKKTPQKVLLGVEYMPLRREFSEQSPFNINDMVRNVLITTGGSDPLFAAGEICDGILESKFLADKDIVYHIVSGPFNAYRDELFSKYGNNTRVMIHENVKDMKALISQCDVVITATGSTIYEVSAIGVPMLCFYFAENQRQGAEAFAKLAGVVNAGNFAENKELVVRNLVHNLAQYIENKVKRTEISMKEMKVVDGKGARKLAKSILELNNICYEKRL